VIGNVETETVFKMAPVMALTP